MKKITCRNCGAKFSDDLSKCPYCGTMNRKGAYKEYRSTFAQAAGQIFGLKAEVYESLSKLALMSMLRGFIMIFICVVIGVLFGLNAKTNYYSDKEYDQKAYDKIVWEDENLDKLEKAYADGDYDTVYALLNQTNSVSYSWQHYTAFSLKKEYQEIVEDPDMSEYKLRDVLYYLYYPGYYGNVLKMSDEEYAQYLESRESVIALMEQNGYSEAELKNIYDSCKDDMGYLNVSDVRKLMKEEKDG